MILNIKVIEAKEFPNNTGKTDAYVELFFKDDLKKIRTRTLDIYLHGILKVNF